MQESMASDPAPESMAPAAELDGNAMFLEAARLAMANNPQMRNADYTLESAREAIPTARASLLPTIEGSVAFSHSYAKYGVTRTQSDPTALTLSLTQALFNRQAWISYDQSKPNVAAYEHDHTNTEQAVIMRVAEVYLGYLEAQSVRDLARSNLAVIESNLKATIARFEAGELTRTDVSQARARLASAQADLEKGINGVNVSAALYREVVGQAPPKVMAAPTIGHQMDDANLDQLFEKADIRPDMMAQGERVHVAEKSVDFEKAGHWPTATLSGSLSRTLHAETGGNDLGSYDSHSLTVTVTAPIYEGGATESGVRGARADLEAQRATYDQLKLQARREVEQALLDMRSADAVVASLESALKAARDALAGVRDEFNVGARTALDLLDAQNEAFSAETNLIQARYNAELARFSLLSATGQLTMAELEGR
ncbi:putative TolC family type I secretion outer membrane protein [Magnetofaba australis IT-1]|uniref:Putative TolC family type I secretion outer membrane protein n=2 Tax=Magnetofaba TaxID=1472292 RepID=A0A1Y2K9P3_9PROT|nr:putative TolC family type I secretion outer membrane protein [Magnetofaba australis IT-1]